MKAAIISVSDKTGILPLAKKLSDKGYLLLSTGGTEKIISEAGIPVTKVENLTKFPECLGGRVKTLHPKIFAGVLARRNIENDMEFLNEQEIPEIEFVVVNLYPFKETIKRKGSTWEEAIENIDIGGPSLLRAAAKNHETVSVLCDADDYEEVIERLGEGRIDAAFKKYLAAKAFTHTADYDSMISTYFVEALAMEKTELKNIALGFERKQSLRYGENPHQKAAFFTSSYPQEYGIGKAEQLQGKELSYNNIADASAAIDILRDFADKPSVVSLKHQVPCGIGSAETIEEAFHLAYESDPVSIFGGIIAANRTVTKEMALEAKPIFLEIIIAPDFTDEAMEILSQKKNLRVLKLKNCGMAYKQGEKKYNYVSGGMLVQDIDISDFNNEDVKIVTKKGLETGDMELIRFAMRCAKNIKSNAICLTQGLHTVGVGAGQPNRITSVELACKQAGERSKGAILASDAFFPFEDCVQYAAKNGIRLIVQPGGSIRDEESIIACDELGIAMVFTGQRHFKH